MRHLFDQFIRVFALLFLGAAGAAQTAHPLTPSNYPAEWWSPDGVTYLYVAPDEANIPPVGDP